MASKSQTKYMTAVALVVGVTMIIERHYSDKPGRESIKKMNADLKSIADKALLLAHGDLSRKDIDGIWHKIKNMDVEGAPSIQVYLSMLIGIVSDLVVQIPEKSNKYPSITAVLRQLEKMYGYYAQRTRQEKFDIDGTSLLWNFNKEFNHENDFYALKNNK